MLTPKQLDPEAVRPGVFVETLIDGNAHRVTPVPANPNVGWGCQQCAFFTSADCTSVRCFQAIWLKQEDFYNHYLAWKLTK